MLFAAVVQFGSGEASGAQLTASWVDNSGGVAATKLERRLAGGAAFAAIADVPPSVTSYVDTSVSSGTTYCYRALAHNASGVSPYSSEACGTARSDGLLVSVSKAGDGAGTVVSSPTGIDCGATCSSGYVAGAPVVLTATPAVGSNFAGWSGSGCAGTAPCTVVGNAPVAVTANFSRAFTVAKPLVGRCTLPAGDVGVPYGASCALKAGSPPYSCTMAGGSVPSGLTLGSGCGVTGTPAIAGPGKFSMRVTDAAGLVRTVKVHLKILPPPRITTTALPSAIRALPYATRLSTRGGREPFSWVLSEGTLQPGLRLDAARGMLTGSPTTTGISNFTVKVTDRHGRTDQQTLRLAVSNAPPPLVANCPDIGHLGVPYPGCTLAGGVPPYTCAVTTGALPDGVALGSGCKFTGAPTTPGIAAFDLRVTDTTGMSTIAVSWLDVVP